MKLRLFLLALILVLPTVGAANQLTVFFEERGRIISYYDEYFVTTVNGTAWIANPTNTTLYNIIIPFNMNPMTLIETGGTSYTSSNQILMPILTPYANISFTYKIVGVPFNDPMDNGRGVFQSAIIRLLRSSYGSEDGRIYSSLMGRLMKSNVENASVTGKNARLVSVVLANPTPFYYNITEVRVIKTRGLDPNRNISTGWIEEWTFPNAQYPKSMLYAWETHVIDIYDLNASEGEVYWLSSDVFIPDVVINGTNLVKRLTQDDVLVFEGQLVETLDNGTNVSLLQQPMFIQKKISKSVVQPGDTVTVEIIITNLGFKTEDVWVYDSFPYGFELSDALENVSGRNMSFKRKVPPHSPLILKYNLLYTDPNALGIDYFAAARLDWKNQTLYSQPVSFVRRYVPERVLYVQKSLKYSLNNELVVKIEITNLGQAQVADIVLKEYLGAADLFREISRVPYAKGVWQIPELDPGNTWTVTYVTNEHTSVNLLPEIFGISSNFVMKTLILENVIDSRFSLSGTRIIEIIGILAIVSLPILYFMLIRREKLLPMKKTRESGGRIDHLRNDAMEDPQSRINRILRESGGTKDKAPSYHAPHHHSRLSDVAREIDDIKKKL